MSMSTVSGGVLPAICLTDLFAVPLREATAHFSALFVLMLRGCNMSVQLPGTRTRLSLLEEPALSHQFGF